MKKIYFDNGSTSFPKAPGVSDAIKEILDSGCYNINRGGYSEAYALGDLVFETREKLASFFGMTKSSHVIFTPSVTYSLNFLLKGLLNPGDHILVSSMEHNAVMRPLTQLKSQGITFDVIPCSPQGILNPEDLEVYKKPNTRGIVMTHASNVCGTILPLEKVGSFAKANNLFFIVDAAQTAGIFPFTLDSLSADAIAFTGHKGLLGPQGIGGFVLTHELSEKIIPLVSGGTGSLSNSEETPEFLPDKFEPGTLNLPGITGLNASLNYLNHYGISNIKEKELALTRIFLEGLSTLKSPKAVGLQGTKNRTGIVSVDFIHHDNAEIAYELDHTYGIMTRCGLHCAPRAHQTLGTYPHGTVRFAFSHFNTEEEVYFCLNGLSSLLKK